MSHGPIDGALYERAAQQLDDAEISAVTWITIAMNAHNRVRIANRQPVTTAD